MSDITTNMALPKNRGTHKASHHNKLEKLNHLNEEKELKVRKQLRCKTLEQIAEKLVSVGFSPKLWGEENCSDFQAVKRFGKGRYHYRTYDYLEKIVVESHIDANDPSQDPLNHSGEVISPRLGIEKESNHHIIIFTK